MSPTDPSKTLAAEERLAVLQQKQRDRQRRKRKLHPERYNKNNKGPARVSVTVPVNITLPATDQPVAPTLTPVIQPTQESVVSTITIDTPTHTDYPHIRPSFLESVKKAYVNVRIPLHNYNQSFHTPSINRILDAEKAASAAIAEFHRAINKFMEEGRKATALRVAQTRVLASDAPSTHHHHEAPRDRDRRIHLMNDQQHGRSTARGRDGSGDSTLPWNYDGFSKDGRPTRSGLSHHSHTTLDRDGRHLERGNPYNQPSERDRRIRHHDPQRAPITSDRPRPSRSKERTVRLTDEPRPKVKSVVVRVGPKPTLPPLSPNDLADLATPVIPVEPIALSAPTARPSTTQPGPLTATTDRPATPSEDELIIQEEEEMARPPTPGADLPELQTDELAEIFQRLFDSPSPPEPSTKPKSKEPKEHSHPKSKRIAHQPKRKASAAPTKKTTKKKK